MGFRSPITRFWPCLNFHWRRTIVFSSASKPGIHCSTFRYRDSFWRSLSLWGCIWLMRRKPAMHSLLLILALTSCRQSMSDQPRYKTYQESDFFPDGSSARPLPEGVVPLERDRGELLTKGTVDNKESQTFPFPITLQVLERGQQRFDIFCTPCHDHLGTGEGMAVLRGFRRPPPSFHVDRLRAATPGYFFDVITNGFGAMPSY